MYKAVLFDFDGTLLDTHILILKGLNHVSMSSRGIPFSKEEHLQILGRPLNEQIKSICPGNVNYWTSSFQSWYRKNHNEHACPYDDIVETLHLLRSEGLRLGIVTNNSRKALQLGLDLLGIESLFEIIITRDDVHECKPSPEGILQALKSMHVHPESCVYVGDSSGDIHAARAAGVMPVLVGWTTLTLDQIHALSPIEFVQSPYEIPILINLLNTDIA